MMPPKASTPGLAKRRAGLSSACVLVLCACLVGSSAAIAATAGGAQNGPAGGAGTEPSATATIEQCVPAAVQSERSAVFAAEMTAMSASARMAIRIEIQELLPGEAVFHTITAPGLGVWRFSDPGVKAYKYVKQVTNLFAPASYRAKVHFRWLNAKGRLMRSNERHTPRCRQPASASFPASAASGAAGLALTSG